MRNFIYKTTRACIKLLLGIYFGKIEVNGLANVPKNKPVLFLSNHQNAFLDTILIATDCNRSPYFLTRSDVFKNNLLKKIFNFFKMIPIYRIRDGIDSLKNNKKTFDLCSTLFKENKAVVIFPEANHNLKRKVRPLSKGFTRILLNTLEKYPDIDMHLVPVGLNYKNASSFPDKVSVCYGAPILVKDYYKKGDGEFLKNELTTTVFNSLKDLTTHIENDEKYEAIITRLDAIGVDYLKPKNVNRTIETITSFNNEEFIETDGWFDKILATVFYSVNFPVLLIWKLLVKEKIKEKEFLSTARFAFSIIAFLIYFLILFTIGFYFYNVLIGAIIVASVFIFNMVYKKLE